jgi:hypothetical protein
VAESYQPETKRALPIMRKNLSALNLSGTQDKNSRNLNFFAINLSGAETYQHETKRALPIRTKTLAV